MYYLYLYNNSENTTSKSPTKEQVDQIKAGNLRIFLIPERTRACELTPGEYNLGETWLKRLKHID